ncbi:hypothetical protein POTOM_014949 [Populus tomentosa]|uniref:Uncharacterized protein n=1 Tax=Populus tomentosa TaxID=118781 RepID=A0A8X8CWP2_POPTO|nr:hypothetical protein POTOM_014949 [Populus tomentosa]
MELIYFTLLLFYTILFMSSPAQYSLISLLNNGIDRPPYSLYCPYSLLVMYNNDVLLNNGFVLFHNSSKDEVVKLFPAKKLVDASGPGVLVPFSNLFNVRTAKMKLSV